MNKEITLSRQTLYGGRNGIAKLTGLHLFMDSKDNLNIFPLNTKGGSTKTFLEIPKEDIPAMIAALQESIGQTPGTAYTWEQ